MVSMTKQELHVKEMEEKYSDFIKYSKENTKFYDDNNLKIQKTKQKSNPSVILINATTSDAIFKYAQGDQKVCALNFASFTHPGGGYIIGSHAQEESLCADSCLYNVLSQFPDYYAYNIKHTNNGLYENRALYSPKVVFKNTNMKAKCDILTCASPNKNSFVDNGNENKKALKSRIKFILNIIKEEHPDIVILGAFGCGAFGQNPKAVANYFYEMIDEYLPADIKVVFAIPKSNNENYDIFSDEMLKYVKL